MEDVAIVGSGVAGSLIAYKLSQEGLKVVLLEAGDSNERAESVERYRNSWRRDPNSAYIRYKHASYPDKNSSDQYLQIKGEQSYWVNYLRQSGGSTWHWTGITPRFLPSDFQLKTKYGVGQDWPITYEDIESYYLDAERELGISGDNDLGSPRSGPYPMSAIPMPYSDRVIAKSLKKHNLEVHVLPAARNTVFYDHRPACCGNNSCTPICPIGAQYSADIHIKKALKNGVKLINNAVASFIHVNDDGKIDSIDYKQPDGTTKKITGKNYVIACNGIETPKLLLISKSNKQREGVANSSGLVGLGLMDHPTIAVDFLMPVPIYTGRGPQVVSTIDIGRDGDFRSEHAAGKFFILNTHDIQSYVTNKIEYEKNWNDINDQIRKYSSHYGFIGVELEQLPQLENKIIPSKNDFDILGIPKPEIHMKFDGYLGRAEIHFKNTLNQIIRYLNAEKIQDYEIGQLWPNHPMGTTCMGIDRNNSVVNINCRSHDHNNLYITGSSVFPTGGTANPTLTIAALALKLADHLKYQVQQ